MAGLPGITIYCTGELRLGLEVMARKSDKVNF